MDERYSREAMLIGGDAVEKLRRSRVLICGVGGVGSYIAEGLARGGVGHIYLCDFDVVSLSNINRQLIALTSTVGRKKTAVMAERIRDIDPSTEVTELDTFLDEDNIERLLNGVKPDYIADAIDSVPSKKALILKAHELDLNIISSMGTGNKLDPSRFKITDISKTSVCPLAKKMRLELKKAGLAHHKVLFSDEPPLSPPPDESGRHVPGSVSFVPSVAGLTIAGEIIRDLISR